MFSLVGGTASASDLGRSSRERCSSSGPGVAISSSSGACHGLALLLVSPGFEVFRSRSSVARPVSAPGGFSASRYDDARTWPKASFGGPASRGTSPTKGLVVERALGSSTPSLVGTAKAMETLLKLETGRAPWADGHDRRPRGRDFQKGPGPRLASCGDGYAAPGSSGGHRSLGGRPGKLVGVLAIGAGWAFRGHTFGEGAVEAGLGLRGWRGVFLLRLARTRGSRRWGALRGY
ncbi:hypothetical protein V8E36_008544, partial [Tilletia maclaganii]